MKKIAFTFAGREKVMRNQVIFMRDALARGIVDEWHVWDFSRNESDKNWLSNVFGESRIVHTPPELADYSCISSDSRDNLRIRFTAESDAKLILMLDHGVVFECLLGLDRNSRSEFRLSGLPSGNDPIALVTSSTTLCEGENVLFATSDLEGISVYLNGDSIFQFSGHFGNINSAKVATGEGVDGRWFIGGQSKTFLVDNGLSGYAGFRSVYQFYSHKCFFNSIFLKLDDDIVYCDVSRLSDFLDFVGSSSDLTLVSANVVNNGVCAHFQQVDGLIPDHLFDFEYPPNGNHGRLWGSSRLCEKLHNYFLSNLGFFLKSSADLESIRYLPSRDRFSINFMAFKYPIMLMMISSYFIINSTDDELIMTQGITKLYGIKKIIFNHLIVSHLSFFKQDETLNTDSLLPLYYSIYP